MIIQQRKAQEIIACAGPEGDLSYEEKLKLNDQGFIFTALTFYSFAEVPSKLSPSD